MSTVAMIPARLGSKRVIKKNLRLIQGKPLIAYVVEAVQAAGCFDRVVINSEAPIFGKIAEEYGVEFYQRPEEHSTDSSTNDGFMGDFLTNTECERVIQILPTSPLITPEEIREFTHAMIEQEVDTLVSVEHAQIGCLYEDKPINFAREKLNPPSQTMEPIKVYATVLMGWRRATFLDHLERLGCAYHGGDGKIGTYELRGLSTVDIDREEDFRLAAAIIKARNEGSDEPISFYGDEASSERSEVDVPSILVRDGVAVNDLHDANHECVSLDKILAEADMSVSWSKRMIDTESNSMTVISQLPGEGNRRHYHPDWNEWWYILDGQWEWEIEGERRIVEKGDVVFMRKGRWHCITAVGDKPAIRMAVSRADVAHVYAGDEGTSN